MATKKDQTQQTEQPAERVTVTLRKPHEHAGQPREPGDTIDVLPRQAERLRKRGIID